MSTPEPSASSASSSPRTRDSAAATKAISRSSNSRSCDELVGRLYERGKALSIAEYFEIDDVIDPSDTRRWLDTVLGSVPERATGTVGPVRPGVDTW